MQPAIDAIAGLSCSPGDGAFYLFVDARESIERKKLGDDVAFCEGLLEETGVALVPGTAFGAPGYVRISFAAALDVMHEAIARLKRFAES